MKLAVIGSRTCSYEQFMAHEKRLEELNPEKVISGGAIGADSFAAQWARKRNIPLEVFRPEYSQYGNGATFIRNRQIVAACDMVLAFHDGRSKGTLYTIKEARKIGKKVEVVLI